MGQSWPEGHSLPTSALNPGPWRALSGSNWCVNSRGRVMMTMTRTRMTIICQALGWALFQLYYPLHPPTREIVWPPTFLFSPETRKDTFHKGENAQGLIAGKWQSWWVNTGLLTSKSHTLLGSLITWRPFPFRSEVCCPVSRIGLHSVPCRWLEPHIHAGWFTLYLHSHSFPISTLVASPLPFVFPNATGTPKNLLWRVSSFKSEQHNLCSRQASLYHYPSLLPYCFPARPRTQVHFHLHTHQC